MEDSREILESWEPILELEEGQSGQTKSTYAHYNIFDKIL
jgi:hypothetical protein